MKELFNTLSNVSNFLMEKRFVYQQGAPTPKPKIDTSPEAGRDYLLGEVDKEVASRKEQEKAMAKGDKLVKESTMEFEPDVVTRSAESLRKDRQDRLAKMSPEQKINAYKKVYNALSPADRKAAGFNQTPEQYALAFKPETEKSLAELQAERKEASKARQERIAKIPPARRAALMKKMLKMPGFTELVKLANKPKTTREQLEKKIAAIPAVREMFKALREGGAATRELLKDSDKNMQKALASLDEAYRLQQQQDKAKEAPQYATAPRPSKPETKK